MEELTCIGEACGKAILAGEHFVVYGAPAIAIPVTGRRVRVALARRAGPWTAPDGIVTHLRALMEHEGWEPENHTLRVESTLPLGQGLGGSAALAVALLRAMGVAEGDELNRRAFALEGIAHGRPSGIDNTVISTQCPIRFQKESGSTVLSSLTGCSFWVATTGLSGSTRQALNMVKSWRSLNRDRFDTLMIEMTELVDEVEVAIGQRDMTNLGHKMNRCHHMLQEIGVSHPRLDQLVEAARNGGAYGAKLTGAGLGGAILAVSGPETDLRKVLQDAGAEAVIQT
jgi:mevalonate kinase